MLEEAKAQYTEAARLRRHAATVEQQAKECDTLVAQLAEPLSPDEKDQLEKFKLDFDKKQAARA